MVALYLFLSVIATTLQSVFKKKVNSVCPGKEISISFVITFFAFLYFLIFSDKSGFTAEILPYAAALAVCYAIAAATGVLAIGCGSMAFTHIILAYSRIIPIFYSLIFLNEKVNSIQITGLVFLGLSLIFTYYKRDNTGSGITFKWLVYVILLFVSNGMCSVFIRMQQIRFNNKVDGIFMVTSLVMVLVILLVIAIIREGKGILDVFRKGIGWCGVCGASNGVANYFSLLCLPLMAGSVFYPVSSAGDLVLTLLFSLIIFKERFSKNQIVGFFLGILSMVLINIK